MKTKLGSLKLHTMAAVAATLILGACASAPTASEVLSAVPDITSIVSDAASGRPDYAADISTGIDLANDFEPGTKVPLAQLAGAVEDGINVATGSKLTSTASDVAAALKVLPDVMSAEQATQALINLSKQANAVTTKALASPPASSPSAGLDPDKFSPAHQPPLFPSASSQVFYSRGWEYVDGGGTAWPMMDMRSEVSPLGMHWRDDAAVEFQRL